MRTFPVSLVTGARQTGKTTLLRTVFGSSHRYVSLEDPDVRARAVADPVGFLREHPPPLILDEIQYAPALLAYIKTHVDEHRRAGQWLLTGSQSFPLMAGISQSLAGRVAVLTLHPLSLGEATRRPEAAIDIDATLRRVFTPAAPPPHTPRTPRRPPLASWLLRGAYPEPRTRSAVDRRMWCASYIQTYIERDVRQLAGIGDLASFERFLRLCAARTGQILNVSDLARDAGVSPPTARRWLSVLEASMLVYLLPPHHRNFGKRIIKSPKLYFIDTSLVTFLVGLHDPEPTLHGPMAGALVETAVVGEWVKAFHHAGEPPALYYVRTRDGLEVDLVIERNGVLYAAEVKATSTVTPHHADALVRFTRLAGAAGTGVVFAGIETAHALAPGVVARPWWALAA
jgi:hypothetical protein